MAAPSLKVQIQGQTTTSADNLNTYEQTCDNFIQLRAFVGLPGIQVFARGTVIPNDGGGGPFYWDASAVGPDDNKNVIIPTGALAGGWVRIFFNAVINPSTRTTFLFGSSLTYTPPANVQQLFIRMIGGGGGGSGQNGTSVTLGGDGTATSFGSVTAQYGSGSPGSDGGQGGTGGTGTADRIQGGGGNGGVVGCGGMGGSGAFGGGAYGITAIANGRPGAANSGGGGGGASATSASGGYAGGGGSGEYVELIITNPAATYIYTVGTGGVGGGGSLNNGGQGGSGIIIIDEIY